MTKLCSLRAYVPIQHYLLFSCKSELHTYWRKSLMVCWQNKEHISTSPEAHDVLMSCGKWQVLVDSSNLGEGQIVCFETFPLLVKKPSQREVSVPTYWLSQQQINKSWPIWVFWLRRYVYINMSVCKSSVQLCKTKLICQTKCKVWGRKACIRKQE